MVVVGLLLGVSGGVVEAMAGRGMEMTCFVLLAFGHGGVKGLVSSLLEIS